MAIFESMIRFESIAIFESMIRFESIGIFESMIRFEPMARAEKDRRGLDRLSKLRKTKEASFVFLSFDSLSKPLQSFPAQAIDSNMIIDSNMAIDSNLTIDSNLRPQARPSGEEKRPAAALSLALLL